MKIVCVLALFSLFVGGLCNCGCIKCNPHLRVYHDPGCPLKVIYKNCNYCECRKNCPYSVQVPVDPRPSTVRYLSYKVQEPKILCHEQKCVERKLNVQLQVPVDPVDPCRLKGLVAKPDRLVVECPGPCDLRKEVPDLEVYETPSCDCRQSCSCSRECSCGNGYNCLLNPYGWHSRCSCRRYVRSPEPQNPFIRNFFGNLRENVLFSKRCQVDTVPDTDLDFKERNIGNRCQNSFFLLRPLCTSQTLLDVLANLQNSIQVPSGVSILPNVFVDAIPNTVDGTLFKTLATTALYKKIASPFNSNKIQLNISIATNGDSGRLTEFYTLVFQNPKSVERPKREKREIHWGQLPRSTDKQLPDILRGKDSLTNKIFRQNKPRIQDFLDKLKERNAPLRNRKSRRDLEQQRREEPKPSKNPFWRVDDLRPPEIRASFSKPAERSQKWEDSQLNGVPKWWQKEKVGPQRMEKWWQSEGPRDRYKRSVRVEDETMLPFYEEENDGDYKDFQSRSSSRRSKSEAPTADMPFLKLFEAPLKYFNNLAKQAEPSANQIPKVFETSKRVFTDLLASFGKDAMNLGANLLFPKRGKPLPKRRFTRNIVGIDEQGLLKLQISEVPQGVLEDLENDAATPRKLYGDMVSSSPFFGKADGMFDYPCTKTQRCSFEEAVFPETPEVSYKPHSPDGDLSAAVAQKADDYAKLVKSSECTSNTNKQNEGKNFQNGPTYTGREPADFDNADTYFLSCRKKREIDQKLAVPGRPNDIETYLGDHGKPKTFLGVNGPSNEEFLHENPSANFPERKKREVDHSETTDPLEKTTRSGFGTLTPKQDQNNSNVESEAEFFLPEASKSESSDNKRVFDEAKGMLREWEIKPKNIHIQWIKNAIDQASSDIRSLEDVEYDDVLIYNDFSKLVALKTDLVEKILLEKELTFTKLKNIQSLKDKLAQQILERLHNVSTNFQPQYWIKSLIQLQKLQCAVTKIMQTLTYGKINTNVLKVLHNLRLTTGDDAKDNHAYLKNLKYLVKALKAVLEQADPSTIRKEAVILWELKNIGKLQRATVDELNKKMLKVRKRNELKILFDLHRQYQDVEDRQRRLLEAIVL